MIFLEQTIELARFTIKKIRYVYFYSLLKRRQINRILYYYIYIIHVFIRRKIVKNRLFFLLKTDNF